MEEMPPPLRVLQLILAGFIIFLALFGLLLVAMPEQFFSIPHVVVDNASAGDPPVVVTRSFMFGNGTETITIAVNASVYAASKKTFRSTMLFGDQKVAGARYYQAMIYDPSQEQIYRDLISQFRKIRSDRNLTDDEYLELIAAAVQTIPYKDGGNTPPKYPAELLAENNGDCDDKSILIAGLLAREGYSVALFKFGPEKHMAMGIGSDAFFYKSTGYTYLEGMTPAYVGYPTAHLLISLNSDPLVIPVSTGTKVYHSGNETSSIRNMSVLAEQKAAELSARLGKFPESAWTGTAYRSLLEEKDRNTAIHRYIVSHPYDRPGTYAYLKWEMPA
jgi:hypothetical protein